LEILKQSPNVKAAFFVAEETGCHGSKNADKNFFSNVGYVLQFDAPGNSMVSEYCMGTKLFDKKSEFFNKCDKVLTEGFDNRNKYQSHPYTDVYALRGKFDFSCINFSIGYYNYHTKNEYVVVEDVFNGINMGRKMIEKLGYKLHYKKSVKYDWRTRSVF
jgi:putative aminopeptidase FrvX